ncbi:sulfurtransferase [Rhodoplanes azumiensis]|uniref:Sulfurtransferase n=1 Tax=Rhodoplanes azumiensis TaxID=1897628 RepID=A0ABW5AMS7_9BRAD
MNSPLVSNDWLESHLTDPDLRIIEISGEAEPRPYCDAHIPGAIFLFWKDACWHPTDRELITPEALAAMFGRLGIGPETTVVLYGEPVQYGTYAYWAFTMAGHKNLKVLDGGRRKWMQENRPRSQTVPHAAPVPYPTPAPDRSMRLGRDDVRAKLGRPERLLLDVRSAEEYLGVRLAEYATAFDHGAMRYGRIPGARHLYFRCFLNDDNAFKTQDEMRRALAVAGVDPGAHEDVVVYCRMSHRATLVWVALEKLLGYRNVKIYDGSWTEWGSIVGFPVEK